MSHHTHATPGLEHDLLHAIKHWNVDGELDLPASVLATYLMAALQSLQTVQRRAREIEAAESGS